jgi:hypothetical protein
MPRSKSWLKDANSASAGGVCRIDKPSDRDNKPKKQKRITSSTYKALECRICYLHYSVEDILSGLYRLETMICGFCYANMQRKPHRISCFGKPDVIRPDGKRLAGYNPEARECKSLCPDRILCAQIVAPESPGDDEPV